MRKWLDRSPTIIVKIISNQESLSTPALSYRLVYKTELR